ncbi:ABC transporter permease [Paenibacillus sp. 481]|uniref:ABC transporter permease n=1 Tax=Paenibacillus sp. 481 TaxID=2835869 RepID=UPI001E4F2090|nr:ABC transporter permease [Paenibacillus sp. 481]UHA73647.1 ABC transporter permease [Paenibacillus sp. 481]
MKTLLYCEFTRLWQRRWLWLVVLSSPILAYITGSYFLWLHAIDSSAVSDTLFPIVGLRENLHLICNIVIAAIVATIFTEEFRGGQLRLLFLRRFTRGQIFFSKLIVVYLSVFILLVVLGLSLWGVGELRLPDEENSVRLSLAFKYTILYYLLGYATLVCIGSLFAFIAMYSKNVTYALGICMAYILAALLFDGFYLKLAALFSGIPYIHELISYMLIPYTQRVGLDASFSGVATTNGALLTIFILHVTLFNWLAYRRFVADDYTY